MGNKFAGTELHHPVVHRLYKEFTYTDSQAGSALSLGWVPAGAYILDAGINVTTAFNAATTNVADMGFRNAVDGTADDADEFAGAIATGTAGVIAADNMATAADNMFPSGAEITVTPSETGTASTAGAGCAWVQFIVPDAS